MSGLYIKSDFTDYYDALSNKNSIITYNRYLNTCMQRGSALKYLRSIGIKTLELRQVNQFFRGDGPIVVYSDPKGHSGKGKVVMDVDKAIQYYGNCIGSKYYNNNKLTIKYLQIGKRRFTLYFEKNDCYTVDIGTLVDVNENTSEYNWLIGLPIFSIDYISNGHEMIATDFNEVQNLHSIGMDKYLSPNEVVREVIDSLAAYNKL